VQNTSLFTFVTFFRCHPM